MLLNFVTCCLCIVGCHIDTYTQICPPRYEPHGLSRSDGEQQTFVGASVQTNRLHVGCHVLPEPSEQKPEVSNYSNSL